MNYAQGRGDLRSKIDEEVVVLVGKGEPGGRKNCSCKLSPLLYARGHCHTRVAAGVHSLQMLVTLSNWRY